LLKKFRSNLKYFIEIGFCFLSHSPNMIVSSLSVFLILTILICCKACPTFHFDPINVTKIASTIWIASCHKNVQEIMPNIPAYYPVKIPKLRHSIEYDLLSVDWEQIELSNGQNIVKFQRDFENVPKDGATVYLAYTDYENISIFYSCRSTSSGLTRESYLVLQSRLRKIPLDSELNTMTNFQISFSFNESSRRDDYALFIYYLYFDQSRTKFWMNDNEKGDCERHYTIWSVWLHVCFLAVFYYTTSVWWNLWEIS
jgi:hypothetical protein